MTIGTENKLVDSGNFYMQRRAYEYLIDLRKIQIRDLFGGDEVFGTKW